MSTVTATPEEKAAFTEAANLWLEISRGRATLDLRHASESVRQKAQRMGQLQDSIRPEVTQLLLSDALAQWEVNRQQAMAAARRQLSESGFAVGDRVSFYAGNTLGIYPGRTYHGVVKASKHGQVYVAAKDPSTGKAARYDLFAHAWQHDKV